MSEQSSAARVGFDLDPSRLLDGLPGGVDRIAAGRMTTTALAPLDAASVAQMAAAMRVTANVGSVTTAAAPPPGSPPPAPVAAT